MKKRPLITLLFIPVLMTLRSNQTYGQANLNLKNDTVAFHAILESYYQQSMVFDPLTATLSGDHRFDDQLPNDISAAFLEKKYSYERKILRQLKQFDIRQFNTTDKISYGNLTELIRVDLAKSKYHFEYLPVNQFFCIPLLMGQLGSGAAGQPFNTPEDYSKWLKRVTAFLQWMDTAVNNMQKGMETGIVLPRALVEKMIPQMEDLGNQDHSKNIFYNPIRALPDNFTKQQKQQIKEEFERIIDQKLLVSYRKFAVFLKNEYLPKAQTIPGLFAITGGKEMYKIYIRQFTTLNTPPEEIYQTGINEVNRITKQMNALKNKVGFKGSLQAFFKHLRTSKQFMPFTTPEQVLETYRNIYLKIQPHLKDYFDIQPANGFEIRRVEAYREAAQNGPSYLVGSLTDKRPGIFYVPVPDATKINVTFLGMEATFLHEAIPGHHYQISLQMENTKLPKFRQQINFSAFTEGWALYVETLGKALGCYTDPYQLMGAYNNDIHRAIRLVTDVGIHTGKMTKEQAIQYMLQHESISRADATLSVERYIGFPGQALSYKTGVLAIINIKQECEKALGRNFDIRKFHRALLSQGDMPLTVLKSYMEDWIKTQH